MTKIMNIDKELDMAYDKVVLSFRVNRDLRDRAHKIARLEARTLANWYELIVLREVQKREGKESTLEDKFDYICDKLYLIREDTKNIKSPRKQVSNEKKENKSNNELQQVLDLELPDTLSYEMWKDWNLYLIEKRGNRLTVKLATEILERWQEADENGWDLDELVQLAIQRKWSDAVWEKHLNEERKEEKPFWADAK